VQVITGYLENAKDQWNLSSTWQIIIKQFWTMGARKGWSPREDLQKKWLDQNHAREKEDILKSKVEQSSINCTWEWRGICERSSSWQISKKCLSPMFLVNIKK
jgi:hypothetical protein